MPDEPQKDAGDDDPVRRELYEAIQMLAAGHPAVAVLHALCESVAMAVGYMAADLAQADAVIDGLPADLKRIVRENWRVLRDARGRLPEAPLKKRD